MTAQERHKYLTDLGCMAVARALVEHAGSADAQDPEALSRCIRKHMGERMAQAAQVWEGEVSL